MDAGTTVDECLDHALSGIHMNGINSFSDLQKRMPGILFGCSPGLTALLYGTAPNELPRLFPVLQTLLFWEIVYIHIADAVRNVCVIVMPL